MNDKRPIDVLVFGYLCVDLHPVFEARESLSPVGFDSYFRPGTLTELGGMSFTIGGIVGNTGLMLHKIGKAVHLAGLIGRDHLGELILKQLEERQVGHSLSSVSDEGTSFGIVLAPPGLDRMFLEFPGCSRHLSLKHVDMAHIGQSKIVHFGYLPLLNNFFNNDGILTADLLKKAQDLGAVTSMDLCLPDEQGQGKGTDWDAILKRILPFTDIVTPSIEEILYMLKPDVYREMNERFGNQMINQITTDMIRLLGEQLIGYGAKVVLLKLAHRGVYLFTGDMQTKKGQSLLGLDASKWSVKECFQEAYPVNLNKMANASGAGDTSIAAFLSALLDRETPEQALRLAAMAGKESLYCNDLYTEFPDWEVIKDRVRIEQY